jgi:hypothetical protein
MGDSINPAPDLVAQLLKNTEFISDLARFHEQLPPFTESFIRKKYGNLNEIAWTQLGESDELVHAIELETIRRTRNGASKREKAQQHIVAAPDILNDIMRKGASDKHKIDAIKTLDALSGTSADDPPTGDTYTITINLGADHILRFGGSRAPNPNDDTSKIIDHHRIDTIKHDTTDANDDNDADADDDTPKWLPVKKDDRDQGGGIPW